MILGKALHVSFRKTNKSRLTSISYVVSASSKWDSGLLYERNEIAKTLNLRSIVFTILSVTHPQLKNEHT